MIDCDALERLGDVRRGWDYVSEREGVGDEGIVVSV